MIVSNEYFEGNSKFRGNVKIEFLTLFQVAKNIFPSIDFTIVSDKYFRTTV